MKVSDASAQTPTALGLLDWQRLRKKLHAIVASLRCVVLFDPLDLTIYGRA